MFSAYHSDNSLKANKEVRKVAITLNDGIKIKVTKIRPTYLNNFYSLY